MWKTRSIAFTGALALTLVATGASAKVSQSEAAKLGTTLTPIGATKAANKDGTIPEWTGGLATVPTPSGNKYLPNPYKDDKIRFTITSKNYEQYKDKLSPGLIAMFKHYPDFKMNIYPTHRPASYPKKVYDWTKKNALHATLVGQNGIHDAAIGFPFPIPKNGAEAIWNHSQAWHYPHSSLQHFDRSIVSQDGSFYNVKMRIWIKYVYGNFNSTPEKLRTMNPPDMNVYFLQVVDSPSRLAGEVLLVWEPVNQKKHPRSAWIYNPGQRRVRRAPNVEFDNTTGTHSDGLQTDDQFNMWNGSLSQYNWKLLGKKEMYIPYDSYALEQDGQTPKDIVRAHHINQDLARYELHRVWVVQATLKKGIRDMFSKQVFYLDEDSWNIALADWYDDRGDLWRVGQGYLKDFYDIPSTSYALYTINDLTSGRYIAMNIVSGIPSKAEKYPDAMFTPANLRRVGFR